MPQTYEIIGGDHRPHGPVTGRSCANGFVKGVPATKPWCASAGRKLGNHRRVPEFRPLQGLPWVPVNQPRPDPSLAVTSLVLGIVLYSFRQAFCWRAGRVLRTPGAFANCPVRWRIGRHRTSHCRVGFGYIGTLIGAVMLILFVMLAWRLFSNLFLRMSKTPPEGDQRIPRRIRRFVKPNRISHHLPISRLSRSWREASLKKSFGS